MPKEKNPRKIIQIAATPETDSSSRASLFALCDDGTVWVINPNIYKDAWFKLPEISQGAL